MTWESKSQDVNPDSSTLGCTLAFSMLSFDFKNPAQLTVNPPVALGCGPTFAVTTD